MPSGLRNGFQILNMGYYGTKKKKFAGRVPVETLKEWGFNVESIQRNDEIWNDLESGRKQNNFLHFL